MPLIDETYKDLDEPVYEFSTKILLPFAALKSVVDRASIISDKLKITIESGVLSFAAQEQSKKGNFSIGDNLSEDTSVSPSTGNFSASYALKELGEIVNAGEKLGNPICVLEFGDDYPIKVTLSKDNLIGKFFLGPRMDRED